MGQASEDRRSLSRKVASWRIWPRVDALLLHKTAGASIRGAFGVPPLVTPTLPLLCCHLLLFAVIGYAFCSDWPAIRCASAAPLVDRATKPGCLSKQQKNQNPPKPQNTTQRIANIAPSRTYPLTLCSSVAGFGSSTVLSAPITGLTGLTDRRPDCRCASATACDSLRAWLLGLVASRGLVSRGLVRC